MIKPRQLPRPERDDDERADLLADFCAMLIDALQIPEVVAALTDAVDTRQLHQSVTSNAQRAAARAPITARGQRRS